MWIRVIKVLNTCTENTLKFIDRKRGNYIQITLLTCFFHQFILYQIPKSPHVLNVRASRAQNVSPWIWEKTLFAHAWKTSARKSTPLIISLWNVRFVTYKQCGSFFYNSCNVSEIAFGLFEKHCTCHEKASMIPIIPISTKCPIFSIHGDECLWRTNAFWQ